MTIRNRLSAQFTTIVASVLLLFCALIYYITHVQLQADFYEQLSDRTLTTAYIFLEEDELPPDVYDIIRQRFTRTLPGEVAQLFNMDNEPEFVPLSDEVRYDDDLINLIRDTEYHEFTVGERQAVGLFYRDNQGDFVVIVSAINAQGQAHLANLRWALGAGFLISVVILYLAGRFFAAQSVRPIPRVVQQVNQISPSDLSVRLDTPDSDDEITELTRTFNRLLDRLEANFAMQQRFVANASHELRTPLTSVIGEIEVTLSKKRPADEYIEVLQSIHHDALTLHELISGLLELAQTESEKLNEMLQPVRVDELVLEAALLCEKKYPGSSVQVNFDGDNASTDDFILPANRALLLNAFVNLVDNGLKFNTGTPKVEIRLSASREGIEIMITDNGIGIPDEDIDRVFDPFYRSGSAISYKGFGIGLSLVQRVLHLLQGEIRLQSESDNGTTVTIFFKKTA